MFGYVNMLILTAVRLTRSLQKQRSRQVDLNCGDLRPHYLHLIKKSIILDNPKE